MKLAACCKSQFPFCLSTKLRPGNRTFQGQGLQSTCDQRDSKRISIKNINNTTQGRIKMFFMA